MRIKYFAPKENISEVFEMAWNKGLVMSGTALGILSNPFWFALIIPGILFEVRIGDEK